MQRAWCAALPALLGALLLLAAWGQLSWNATAGAAARRLQIRVRHPLGQVPAPRPKLTLATVLDGSWQAWTARQLGTRTIVNYPAVRWKNEAYATLFGMSGVGNVAMGQGRELMEVFYVTEYCTRDLAAFRPQAAPWAQQIRTMQDAFERRGVVFLYVVTPSKVATYPQIMPDGVPCPSRPEDRRGKLAAWRAALDEAGVRYVDTATLVAEATRSSAITLFPRGGTHWNQLGAALAAQAVTEAVNARRPLLTPFRIDWTVSTNPQGTDRDIYDMVDRPIRHDRYQVPAVAVQSDPPASCGPARVTQVAGSFIFGINNILVQAACPPELRTWFYWDVRQVRYPEGRMTLLPVEPAQRTKDLADPDVLIVEENESTLPSSPHVRKLLDMLAEQTASAQ